MAEQEMRLESMIIACYGCAVVEPLLSIQRAPLLRFIVNPETAFALLSKTIQCHQSGTLAARRTPFRRVRILMDSDR